MSFLKSKYVISLGNFLSKQISQDEQDIMLDFLEEDSNAKLLDLGCLNGKRTSEFMGKVKPERTYGIDIVDKFLRQARKNYGIIGKRSDLNKKFPIPTKSMDAVVTAHVIEHLTNTDNFLHEIYRVLKPGGYVVISTDNLSGWFDILSLILGYQPTAGPTVSTQHLITLSPLWWETGPGGVKNVDYPMHHNVMTMKALKTLLTRYKFEIEEIAGSGYPPIPYPFAKLFCQLDLYHSMFTVIKARKK
ncbi:MAG: class I SAM-dependent methyltransferase [Candidatus Hodarchaeota archaeon]